MAIKEVVYSDEAMAALDAAELETQLSPEEFDADAAAYLPPPPIHDGVYFMKFENAGVKVKDSDELAPYRTSKWSNETREHFEVAIKGTIIAPDDPLIDGKMVWGDRAFRTAVDPKRNNTSPVSAFYRDIAGEPIKGLSEAGHAKQLVELLKGAPTGYGAVQNILADTDAEIKAAEAGKKRPKKVFGQKKIMALPGGTSADGKFTGAADHPETGNRCAARARLVGTRSKDWKPTGQKSA